MPHNVSFPHGFPHSPGNVNSPGPASPNSQYSGVPGQSLFLLLPLTLTSLCFYLPSLKSLIPLSLFSSLSFPPFASM